MLDVSEIDLHYGAAQALRRVSLAAQTGKVTCVLGRNGVGKTSLMRAIAGQQPISAGAIMCTGNTSAYRGRARFAGVRFLILEIPTYVKCVL